MQDQFINLIIQRTKNLKANEYSTRKEITYEKG